MSLNNTKQHNIHLIEKSRFNRTEVLRLCTVAVDFFTMPDHTYTVIIRCVSSDGVWNFKNKTVVKLGKDPVTCLLAVHKDMWVAAGHHVYVLTVTTQQGKHDVDKVLALSKKAIIHQVTTMLATSKNVLLPGHNHLLTTSANDPALGR